MASPAMSLAWVALAAAAASAGVSSLPVPVLEPAIVAPRLAARLARGDAGDTLPVWIFFRDRGPGPAGWGARAGLSPRAMSRIERRGRAGLDAAYAPLHEPFIDETRPMLLRVRHRSRYFNAISAEVLARDVGRLSRLSCVRRVDLVDAGRGSGGKVDELESAAVPPRATPPVPPAPYGGSQDQLDQIGAASLLDAGWNGSGTREGGDPVLIAILDTGFRLDHIALQHVGVEAQWDFVQDDSVTVNEPGDGPYQDMHGTTVLGVIAGHRPYHHAGPAWGARYLLAKTEIYDREIRIEEDHWIAGIEWADSAGADIVTSSLGYIDWYTRDSLDGETALCTRAADIAAGHGIVVVNSAGNRGYGGLNAPADGDSVFAAGAVDADGSVAPFSSRGPTADGRIKPDFMARGMRTQSVAYEDTIGLAAYSGTSFAAPLVAGICAQLLDAHPGWDLGTLRDALRATASKGGFPDNDYGYGIPNAALAISYPGAFAGGGAFPNPFALTTRLQLVSPRRAPATVRVYDVRGALVRTIASGRVPAGTHWSVSWDGANDAGAPVPSGVYFLVVRSTELDRVCKLVLVR